MRCWNMRLRPCHNESWDSQTTCLRCRLSHHETFCCIRMVSTAESYPKEAINRNCLSRSHNQIQIFKNWSHIWKLFCTEIRGIEKNFDKFNVELLEMQTSVTDMENARPYVPSCRFASLKLDYTEYWYSFTCLPHSFMITKYFYPWNL